MFLAGQKSGESFRKLVAEEKSGGICSRACRASILQPSSGTLFAEATWYNSFIFDRRANRARQRLYWELPTGSWPWHKSCNRRKSSWPWHRHLIQLAVVPEPLHSFSLEHRPSPKDQKVFQPSRFQRRAVSFGSVNLVTQRPYKDQSKE